MAQMRPTPRRYRAFLSYSHRDDRIATWLHRQIESFRVPRPLIGVRTDQGKVPSRIYPVFRDRDEISASGDLGVCATGRESAAED